MYLSISGSVMAKLCVDGMKATYSYYLSIYLSTIVYMYLSISGSVMAKLCVDGMKATYSYCDEHKIPYKKVGTYQ